MFHQCDAVALPAALERIFVQFDTDAAAAAFSGALASLLTVVFCRVWRIPCAGVWVLAGCIGVLHMSRTRDVLLGPEASV